MKKSELKKLIKECITESAANSVDISMFTIEPRSIEGKPAGFRAMWREDIKSGLRQPKSVKGCPLGTGRTEQAAVEDLLSRTNSESGTNFVLNTINETLRTGMSTLKVGDIVVPKKDIVSISGLTKMTLKAGERLIVKGLLPLHRLEVIPEKLDKMNGVDRYYWTGKLPVVYDDEVRSDTKSETGEYSHSPQMRVGSNENPDLFESGGVVHVISKPVKDTSTGEWVVKWMTNGKRDERKTYYTDDLKDAQDTALQMQKHASEMNKKSLSEGDFNLEKKELMTRHSLDATPNKQVTDLSPDRAPKDEPINESAKDKLKRIIIEVFGEQHFNVGDRVKAEIYGKIVKCDGGFITIQTDAGDEVSMLPPPDNKVEKLEF